MGFIIIPIVINSFLAFGIVRELTKPHPGMMGVYGMGTTSIFISLCIVYIAEKASFHFIPVIQTVKWNHVRYFLKKQAGVIPFSSIKRVVIEGKGGLESTQYRVALITESGAVPMLKAYSLEKEDCEEIATEIRTILKKDADTLIEDSILELIETGRTVDAVKLAREHYNYSLTEAKIFIDEMREINKER